MNTATETKPAILVVEDSKTQAERLRADLEGAFPEFSVSIAENGREALDQVKKIAPVLVISDVIMPEMNGYEMCRALKDDPVLRRVPM